MQYRALIFLVVATIGFTSETRTYHRLVTEKTKTEELSRIEQIQISRLAVQNVELSNILTTLGSADGSLSFKIRPDTAEMRSMKASLTASNLSVAYICDLLCGSVAAEWWVSDGIIIISALKHTESLEQRN